MRPVTGGDPAGAPLFYRQIIKSANVYEAHFRFVIGRLLVTYRKNRILDKPLTIRINIEHDNIKRRERVG